MFVTGSYEQNMGSEKYHLLHPKMVAKPASLSHMAPWYQLAILTMVPACYSRIAILWCLSVCLFVCLFICSRVSLHTTKSMVTFVTYVKECELVELGVISIH